MRIILFILLLSASVIAQPFNKFILTEHIIIPGEGYSNVYFMFRIPYQNLVFEKEGNHFKAGLRLYLEITDNNSAFIKREIKDWRYSANSYEETNSPNIFAEGLLSFTLDLGTYNVLPIITDKNTDRELKLEQLKLNIQPEEKKFLSPIIVNSGKVVCNNENFYKLTNFEGNIPFSSQEYFIIIPSTDTLLGSIDVSVINKNDTIYQGTVNDSYNGEIKFEECENKILLTNGNSSITTKNFILSGISSKLNEGGFNIIIENNSEKIRCNVFWYNKPLSLTKPDFAINALKHIETEEVIDNLLKTEKENLYSSLLDFWKSKDPTPGTEYNELMTEYYRRVDYAERNFASLNGKGGLNTDRGKIYVKYGSPDKIERGSNEQGKVLETWIYDQLDKKFVFVDKQGIGEFLLEGK